MTSSTSHGRRAAAGACQMVLLGSLFLGACTAAPGPAPDATASAPTSAPTPTGTSGVAPGSEPLTHDGRTVLPSAGDDCTRPSVAEIQRVLGDAGQGAQPADVAASSRDGLVQLDCTFALAPAGSGQAADPGNSLIVATTTARDQSVLDQLGLPRLMMSPEPVPGLGSKAWYSLNRLTDTTEYVLEVLDGLTVVRVTLARPADAPAVANPKDKLAALAPLG
ncbi:hypothetical protein QFZ79_002510 [Arthrobacter sp. V4I6]|uniref:hypothetical protein n=1 Tax=unclassified Arthrobacter TaxID=235627 RepID=UPI0027897D40|nr:MULTISPECIES: hypothetical protein [unclassified Arthrobacter]MDQ0820216.1 hypothetical protein [Arthrobacter sp. V1I7]MDQ0854399.1 hypothetical protein [Arthrobacter sp. V4I6]